MTSFKHIYELISVKASNTSNVADVAKLWQWDGIAAAEQLRQNQEIRFTSSWPMKAEARF
jgi:hypothetical protein